MITCVCTGKAMTGELVDPKRGAIVTHRGLGRFAKHVPERQSSPSRGHGLSLLCRGTNDESGNTQGWCLRYAFKDDWDM